MKNVRLLTVIAAISVASSSFGQVVAWDFNAATGNETSVAATTLNSNLGSSSISRGAGIDASSLANAFGATNFSATSFSQAVSLNEFITFAITPASGFEVSLSTLDFNFRRSSSGPNAFQWQYSLDGFSTAGTNLGSSISFTSTTSNGVAQTQIPLSGIPALQSITGTAVLRLYAWGASATSGTFALDRLSGNDVAVGGTTAAAAVPEPSTYAAIFGAVALVGVAVHRRRQRAKAAAV